MHSIEHKIAQKYKLDWVRKEENGMLRFAKAEWEDTETWNGTQYVNGVRH